MPLVTRMHELQANGILECKFLSKNAHHAAAILCSICLQCCDVIESANINCGVMSANVKCDVIESANVKCDVRESANIMRQRTLERNAIGHTHARFKRASVGTNGILECKVPFGPFSGV
jgi:hypothetical protein